MWKKVQVAVLVVACSKGTPPTTDDPAQPSGPPDRKAAAPQLPVAPPRTGDARAARPPTSAVELPPKGFELGAVLGKAKAAVDKVLGKSTQLDDGPWLYDGFPGVALHVVFEANLAVYVSVAAPGFHNTDADRATVLAWMHAPADIDFDRTTKFDFELGVWTPGAQARQLHRRELAQAITTQLKAEGGLAAANYTHLEVTLTQPDRCTRDRLGRLAREHELKAAGFDTLECTLNDTTLHLR